MIGLIDSGMSNLKSVCYALDQIQCPFGIIQKSSDVQNYERMIFPGIGHFKKLSLSMDPNLKKAIKEFQGPFLGICLGMQFLGTRSEEGQAEGLGILDCDVKKLHLKTLPHMGWNSVEVLNKSDLFEGIETADFYFVHTFAFELNQYTLTQTRVEDFAFSSSVKHQNFYGVQFHPERSGPSGLKLLKNFSRLS